MSTEEFLRWIEEFNLEQEVDRGGKGVVAPLRRSQDLREGTLLGAASKYKGRI